jgi:hypothetical protein
MATCKGWMKKGSLAKILEWCPSGRGRKGRPLIRGCRKLQQKGINNLEWVDREEWRRKIKLKL